MRASRDSPRSYVVGGRGYTEAYRFITHLAGRLRSRIQLSTDGNRMYITAVERAFGMDIDYGQIIKVPRAARSRPLQPCGVRRGRAGEPDPHLISTSYIERQNLTMRMSMRRFTRLTNAFSKKVENLAAAVSLHFLHCTFARVHQSLSDPYPQDPGHGRRHRGSRLVAEG